MFFLRKKISLFFLIIAFFAVFAFGFWLGENQKICPICPPKNIDFSLFWEAWKEIHQNYVRPESLDNQTMIYGAIKGMVNSLKDPYTVFFNPKEVQTFLEDISGSFEGVGMEVGIREGQLQVISPLEGTPAKKAGLRPGDKIIKIDNTSTNDISIEEAVKLIRGPKGTYVTLTIRRKGWPADKDIKIKRAKIEVPSLDWKLVSSISGKTNEAGDIAYIKIHQFSEKTNYDFRKAALDILNSPAKKIILDLRNNPGGYLEIARDIAGWFLKHDQIVVIEDLKQGRDKKIYKAGGNAKLFNYPTVILINKGSASASEILASALRDDRGIKLIGETSFGKGSVQELKNLRDGSSLKITVADWLTPKGKLITDRGLKPDIEVKMDEKDYEKGIDLQLNKAIEVIREM
jgi:carboxyl-terminal processing protease